MPPTDRRSRLYLIDGYALTYRAFFAMISRPLLTARGENTSAAFGVTRFLLKVLEEHKPEYLGVVFDAGNSERHAIFPEYKATREKMPTELEVSLPRVRQIIEAFNVPIIELEGFEADDVIGTLATQAVDAGLEAVIVSGDKDFYQLIQHYVCLLNPGRGGPNAIDEEWVDLSNANERLGVPPQHVVDYLGLIGDSSDNIPGVKGIGPKTAIQLIEQFGSVEEIIRRSAEITNKRARESIEQNAQEALLSKRLVTIMTDLDIPLDLADLECGPADRERLKELFLELEFHTLVRDHAAPDPKKPIERAVTYRTLYEPSEVAEVVERARQQGSLALDTQTSSIDAMRAELVGLAIALKPGEAWYLPFRHCRAVGDLLDDRVIKNLPDLHSDEMRPLAELLADPGVHKVGHDLKFDLLVLRRAGVPLRGVRFDTMVASYLIDPNRREHTLDSLALQYLDHRTTTYEELVGKGKSELSYAEVDVERCRDYEIGRAHV